MKTINKQIFALFFATSLISFSCRTKMDINLPEAEIHPVINAMIGDKNPVFVQFSKSQRLLSDEDFEEIKDAQIRLYEDGIFLEELTRVDTGYISTAQARAGHSYRLETSYGSAENIRAETKILLPLSPVSVDTMTVDDRDHMTGYEDYVEYGKKMQFKIKIKDRGNQSEYFLIAVCAKPPIFNLDTINGPIFEGFEEEYKSFPVNSEDPVFMSYPTIASIAGFKGLVLSDDLFNGAEYNLRVSVEFDSHYGGQYSSENMVDSIPVRIKFFSISKDFYQYIISYNKNLDASFNPFAQPVKVFSNIENGLGIFGGYSVSNIDFIVKRN